MVRSQKVSKSKASFSRPKAPPVRQNVRPVAYKPNYYAQQQQQQQYRQQQQQQQQRQQQQQQQQRQQQQQQYQLQQQQEQQQQYQLQQQKELQQILRKAQLDSNLSNDLQVFREEFLILRRRQEEQQRQDQELKRLQVELQEEQRQQKLLLQKQQQTIDKKIAQLQKQHVLDLKAQALTIEKLQEESTLLQQKLKKQLEEEELRKQALQEKQKSQQVNKETIADSGFLINDKFLEESLLLQEQIKEKKQQIKDEELLKKSVQEQRATTATITDFSASLKSSNQTLTPPKESPSSTEMNGNAAGAGGGAATSRKTHLRPILGNSAPQRPPAMKQPTTDTMPAGGGNKRQQHPRVAYPGARSTSGVSVNYRLKQQQTAANAAAASTGSTASPAAAPLTITPPDSPENASSNKTAQKIHVQQPLMPQCQPSVNFKFDPAYDAISSLNQYCVAMGYAPPEYEYTRVMKSNLLHCKVRIGGSIYSSYPKEHPDEAKAKQCTSEMAIERLKELESRKHLSMLSDSEFLDGLFKELIKHPHGIVSHKLPEWYEATVKRQVPSNWWTLLTTSPKIRIETSVNTHIVFANTINAGAEMGPGAAIPANQVQKVQLKAMPELLLPWTDGQQDWSMYITHCDNTMHVWARLIDQSANFEKLTEQLNAYMTMPQNRQPVQKQPIEQQIYLVEVSENWNRVRVMAVDVEQRQCICHFVDFGDEVIFGFDVLYMCTSMFLVLPPQAVCLSMYALDKFEEHPHALPVLAKELAGHSVVTRIITSESQFHSLGGRTQGVLLEHEETDEEAGCLQASLRSACIVGTFYDTSTAEDIHLNDLVANQIIRNTPAPMLKLDQKSNHVLVSHVNDVGDLMVQIPNEDLKFVQRSIDKIMSDSSEQHRVRYSDLLHDQLVCVCDEAGDGGKQWYRGMLTTKPKSPEEEVFDVYYVDDGRLRKTHISNIYRLEANNLALASFPAQALRVRLHDVPPIDNQMVARLRGRLSPKTPVLLKVMEGANDKLPMVTIHARGQDGLYLCLNSAIRMEYEVQSAFNKLELT
ncbi:uncharacterized protein LOC117785685 isoform X2 [Drosophila innubila]|uniref:uncharacterized protein LOC117785685 isoform X2 n=1 Tax=Drosophila innubila TaxID=198719 RepID=UPI00148D6533|nr:uncharacterized protein LOC117785685 isoform X2 [Drosophila innubila]